MESDTKKLTDTTKLLRECDAGTKMAISSINEILEKVEDTKLSEILTKSRNAHEELESEIHSLLNYHKEEQKEPDPIAKGMSFIKTNVKMGIDESDKTVANNALKFEKNFCKQPIKVPGIIKMTGRKIEKLNSLNQWLTLLPMDVIWELNL